MGYPPYYDPGDLTWRYVNDGDYNQDGIVTVGDITPLAIHYGHIVGTDDYDEVIDEDDGGEKMPGQANSELRFVLRHNMPVIILSSSSLL